VLGRDAAELSTVKRCITQMEGNKVDNVSSYFFTRFIYTMYKDNDSFPVDI